MKISVADIRTALPAMSEDFYTLAEYYAKALDDNTDSSAGAGVMTVIGVMSDLDSGTCGFAKKQEVPKAFTERRDYIKAQLPNLCFFWDKFFPDEAEEFRMAAAMVFQWSVPHLQEAKMADDELPYVKAAVEWWLNQIQHPSQDNGEPELAFMFAMFGNSLRAKLDEQQAKRFVEMLSEGIKKELRERDEVSLEVDYHPGYILADIGEALGISDFAWPCKTHMRVSAKKVEVSCGYCKPWETLWEAPEE